MTDLAVRQSDAITTYLDDGTRMCPRCRETELPKALSRSMPGMVAYSSAISLGVDGAAALLWHHGHHKLARMVLLGDIGADGWAVGVNILCMVRYER